jgi:ADP-ribose pyrophosphatase YjhB (NUDIX family)
MKTSNMLKLLKIWNQLGFGDQELEEVQFLELGPFKDLRIEEKGRLELPNKEEIEKRWREHIRLHPYDFDGPLLSLSTVRKEEEVLILEARRTAYRDYIATRHGGIRRLDFAKNPLDDFFPLPIGVGAISLTKDDRIVFGVREKVGIGKGRVINLPAGFFNPESDPTWSDCLRRELKEELGIGEHIQARIMGLVFDCRLSQMPSVAVSLRLPVDSQEIRPANEETGEILLVENDPETVRKWVVEKYPLMPHTKAKLVLHFMME